MYGGYVYKRPKRCIAKKNCRACLDAGLQPEKENPAPVKMRANSRTPPLLVIDMCNGVHQRVFCKRFGPVFNCSRIFWTCYTY